MEIQRRLYWRMVEARDLRSRSRITLAYTRALRAMPPSTPPAPSNTTYGLRRPYSKRSSDALMLDC